MDPNLDRVQQRARRYWYDDGLAEIAIGVVLMAVGLLLLVEYLRLIPGGASSIGLIVVVFAGWWLAGRAVRAAKNRITYPRTGYVSYRRPRERRKSPVVGAVIGAAMGVIMALLIALAPASLAWIPAMDGILAGIFFIYVGYTAGLGRFYLLALLSAILGAGCSAGGLGNSLGGAVFFLGIGLAMAISGGIVLAGYLRDNPPAQEGDHE
jgi:hypothetical protein